MTTLWLIRHATTDANLRYHMIGQTDAPLGDVGRTQTCLLGKRLSSVRFDAIYTSPLQRARQTAVGIAEQNIFHPAIHAMDALQEIHLGEFEGESSFHAYERSRSLMDQALDPTVNDFAFPGGESRTAAVRRFHTAIQELFKTSPDRPIGIVSHGAVIGLWLTWVHQHPLGTFRQFQPKHASITTVTVHFPTRMSEETSMTRRNHEIEMPHSIRLDEFSDVAHLDAPK